MFTVFSLQFKRLLKQPLLVVLYTCLTVFFVYFMGNAQLAPNITIPVYSNELSTEELTTQVDRLNESDEIDFEAVETDEIMEDIRMNQESFALELSDGSYSFFVARETEHLPAAEQYVSQVYESEARLAEVEEEFPDADIQENDIITLSNSYQTDAGENQSQLQLTLLIGMTFYFIIYTVMFLQTNLVEEKRLGTWDRMIFSPVSKLEIYLGHLAHYFVVGLAQTALSFFILTNLLGISLGGNYLTILLIILSFLFVIVALGLLISALVPSSQTLTVVIPIVATVMAMLSGAFWPRELVTNRIILFLGELMPLKHAMVALTEAIQSNATIGQLMQPVGIILLMGVLFMGIGINLMERTSH